ncbi:hypothetical protein GCM10009736_29600 [Actinomadura bangladeshensis]
MTDRDRFRGQDPDDQYGREEYAGQDDTPSSLGYDSAMGYDETRDQGGRIPSGDYSAQGDYASETADGLRTFRAGEGREPSPQEDDYGQEPYGPNTTW